MAVLPTIPKVSRVALHWLNSSTGLGDAVNVFHVAGASAYVSGPAIFTCLDAHVAIGLWSMVSTSYRVDKVAITPLDGVTATYEVSVPAVAKWTGNNGGDPIPNMANIIKFHTAKRGRSYRGRMYLPAVSETVQTNGVLSAGAVTTTETAWNAFITAIGTDATTPLTFGIASYKLSHFEAVLGALCEADGATQRRRLSRIRG